MSTITCPECGKELQVNDPSRAFLFCRHCGTKIAVSAFLKSAQPYPETVSRSDDVSIEELCHQHELELEQLRHEHELELERLRQRFQRNPLLRKLKWKFIFSSVWQMVN